MGNARAKAWTINAPLLSTLFVSTSFIVLTDSIAHSQTIYTNASSLGRKAIEGCYVLNRGIGCQNLQRIKNQLYNACLSKDNIACNTLNYLNNTGKQVSIGKIAHDYPGVFESNFNNFYNCYNAGDPIACQNYRNTERYFSNLCSSIYIPACDALEFMQINNIRTQSYIDMGKLADP